MLGIGILPSDRHEPHRRNQRELFLARYPEFHELIVILGESQPLESVEEVRFKERRIEEERIHPVALDRHEPVPPFRKTGPPAGDGNTVVELRGMRRGEVEILTVLDRRTALRTEDRVVLYNDVGAGDHPPASLGPVRVSLDHDSIVFFRNGEPSRVVFDSVCRPDLHEIAVAGSKLGPQYVENPVLAVLAESGELPSGRPRHIDCPSVHGRPSPCESDRDALTIAQVEEVVAQSAYHVAFRYGALCAHSRRYRSAAARSAGEAATVSANATSTHAAPQPSRTYTPKLPAMDRWASSPTTADSPNGTPTSSASHFGPSPLSRWRCVIQAPSTKYSACRASHAKAPPYAPCAEASKMVRGTMAISKRALIVSGSRVIPWASWSAYGTCMTQCNAVPIASSGRRDPTLCASAGSPVHA